MRERPEARCFPAPLIFRSSVSLLQAKTHRQLHACGNRPAVLERRIKPPRADGVERGPVEQRVTATGEHVCTRHTPSGIDHNKEQHSAFQPLCASRLRVGRFIAQKELRRHIACGAVPVPAAPRAHAAWATGGSPLRGRDLVGCFPAFCRRGGRLLLRHRRRGSGREIGGYCGKSGDWRGQGILGNSGGCEAFHRSLRLVDRFWQQRYGDEIGRGRSRLQRGEERRISPVQASAAAPRSEGAAPTDPKQKCCMKRQRHNGGATLHGSP